MLLILDDLDEGILIEFSDFASLVLSLCDSFQVHLPSLHITRHLKKKVIETLFLVTILLVRIYPF